MILSKDHYEGCFIGGAIGDALGAPLEFVSIEKIRELFGDACISTYIEFNDGIGRITDDTQMTIFTAEGLLQSLNLYRLKGVSDTKISMVYNSYKRWYYTQYNAWTDNLPEELSSGWLLNEKLLYKNRFPGSTCLQSIQSGVCGDISAPINSSKGCGGIMRVAPVGLMVNVGSSFKVGAEIAAITHGHPSGYLSAGFFASTIANINQGETLKDAIEKSMITLKKWQGHEETLLAVERAVHLFEQKSISPTSEAVESLGGGWVGEEALSIALYCSLVYQNNFEKAIALSICHSGDSDSTGSITGNIVGLIGGIHAIPKKFIISLELSSCILQVADDVYEGVISGLSGNTSDEWKNKYRL